MTRKNANCSNKVGSASDMVRKLACQTNDSFHCARKTTDSSMEEKGKLDDDSNYRSETDEIFSVNGSGIPTIHPP